MEKITANLHALTRGDFAALKTMLTDKNES